MFKYYLGLPMLGMSYEDHVKLGNFVFKMY